MHLPIKEYSHYAAIDPGRHGAVGVINLAGTTCNVWDLPMVDGDYDLPELKVIYQTLKRFPAVALGIEWPHPKPGDFGNVAGDAEKFGRGKGYLEAFAYLMGFDYFKLDPAAWHRKLGVPGKTDPEAIPKAAALWDATYPAWTGLIRGPRGGIRDGRLDALLMTSLMRMGGRFTQFVRVGKAMRAAKDSVVTDWANGQT